MHSTHKGSPLYIVFNFTKPTTSKKKIQCKIFNVYAIVPPSISWRGMEQMKLILTTRAQWRGELIGESLSKPHINVLNASGVCMYVFVRHTVNTFVLQYPHCQKSENARAFLGSLTATFFNVSLRGSWYGAIVFLKWSFRGCQSVKDPTNNRGEKET